jgi:hypothetical protein
MRKPEYSNAERRVLIDAARFKGMSDVQIFRKVITGVLGTDKRKRIIIQWGELMGLEPSEALRIAQRAGLVLTRRLPKDDPPVM